MNTRDKFVFFCLVCKIKQDKFIKLKAIYDRLTNNQTNEEISQMTYTHLTMNEVTMIRLYWASNVRVSAVLDALRRSKQTIYKIHHYSDAGKSSLYYCNQYHLNKFRYDRKPISPTF